MSQPGDVTRLAQDFVLTLQQRSQHWESCCSFPSIAVGATAMEGRVTELCLERTRTGLLLILVTEHTHKYTHLFLWNEERR